MQISSANMPPLSGHQHSSSQTNKSDQSTSVAAEGRPAVDSASPTSNSSSHIDKHGSHTAKDEAKDSRESSSNTVTSADDGNEQGKAKDPLTDPASAEYAQVQELKARDIEVRAHEQAHLSAAGQHATSGPTYSYQTGPDGQQYAIGGEVGIDVSAIPDDPEATIAKMEVVQRAATAPAEPSGQDFRVAAQAAQTASAARAELAAQQLEKMQGGNSDEVIATGEKDEQIQSATSKQATTSYDEQQNDREGQSFHAVA